jgi:hypothetical protein
MTPFNLVRDSGAGNGTPVTLLHVELVMQGKKCLKEEVPNFLDSSTDMPVATRRIARSDSFALTPNKGAYIAITTLP